MHISIWLYLLQQFLCSLSLLLSLGLAAQFPRRSPPRLFSTSLLCTLCALAATGLPSPWLRLLLLLPVMFVAPLLAWPGVPKRLRVRMSMLSMVLSLGLTGLLRVMVPLSLPGLLLLPMACGLLSALPMLSPRPTDFPRCTTIEIRCGPAHLTLTALIDSGNLLRDVVTGLPVVMISRRAAARLMTLPPDGELLPGHRLLPVRTVAGTSLMTIFRPDGVKVLTGGAWQPVQTLIGLSPDGYDGFQALVPATLLADSVLLPASSALSQGG